MALPKISHHLLEADREQTRPRWGRVLSGRFRLALLLPLLAAFAVTSANAAISIVDQQISQTTARDGHTVTLRYRLNSSSSEQAWLGATLRAPNGTQVEDLTHERSEDRVTVNSGTAWYERKFFINLPPNANYGSYSVTWEVYWGTNESTASTKAGALQIQEPVPVKVHVLMYHKIGPTAHSQYWVSTQRFEQHVRALLQHGYTIVNLQDVADYRAGLKTPPAKPVVITFDDGYKDLHTYVRPIISKSDLRIPVTAFVLPGRMGQKNTWDVNIDFSQEPQVDHLTWAQTQELHNTGLFDIQSHTMSHANFLSISREQRLQELIQSRAEIEARLNKRVRFFAYPWGGGGNHPDVYQDVRDADYFMAVGIDNVPETQTRNKWALYRHDIHWNVTAEYDASQPQNFLFGSNFLNDPSVNPGGSPHPADTNGDWRMAIGEITAYGAAWRRGDSWSTGPNPIPISYVTRAGALWRGGEAYHYDSSAGQQPTAWVNN